MNESNFAACQEKIAYASYRYSRVSLDRLLREPGLFEETEYQGIWVRRPMELGAMFLIAASHLSQDPAFDWLRLTTRVPETREALEKEKLAAEQEKLAAEEKLAAFMAEFEDIKRQVEILKKH